MLNSSIARRENELRHLERLTTTARDTRDAELERFKEAITSTFKPGQLLNVSGADGIEEESVEFQYLTQWHLNVKGNGFSRGIPLVLTTYIEHADPDLRSAETARRREALRERVARNR